MIQETQRSIETVRKEAHQKGMDWVKTQTIFENRMESIKNPKIVTK